MHRASLKASPADRRLVDALTDPRAFDHPVTTVDVIETHISWLILGGDFVYKIKKPLKLDFLDFGDLEQRRFYCEEEIRLNRPWAPEIYLDVVPITRDNGQPRFGGDGSPIEYAVRMRRFAQDARLDVQLEQNKLTVADMRELGQAIAARHKAAPVVATEQRRHQVEMTKQFIWDNFAALDGYIDSERLSSLYKWTERELDKVGELLWRRFDDGYVRDCHGDLHLANLVRLPSGITSFDCIDFNTDLRDIDVFCDIAFLVMDLVARQRHDLASHFLNRYLERTGDYNGVALLDLFFVYRCLVRAKVATISSQEHEDASDRDSELQEAHRYCDMAWRQAHRREPILVVMHGLSGSGKTWLAEQLMAAMPAIRVRSDIERKRLSGLAELADSASDIGKGIYTDAVNKKVYSRLLTCAARILDSGHNVILDAAFLRFDQRRDAFEVAEKLACRAVLVRLDAALEVLQQRIRRRSADDDDASEAGLAVLDHQLKSIQSLSEQEQEQTIVCDTTSDTDVAAIVNTIRLKQQQ